MILFNVSKETEPSFLIFLRQLIKDEEFGRLTAEAGFNEPNEFDIDRLRQPLVRSNFPASDFYEYQWAIHECGLDQICSYSPAMQVYLASIYVYCNKRQQWGIRIESDYYYLGISAVLDSPMPELARQFSSFLEWLCECVPSDEGYDDFFALLAWIMLRRIVSPSDSDGILRVVEILLAKGYSDEQLSELTVSSHGMKKWSELHCRLKNGDSTLNSIIERIIVPTKLAGA